MRILHFSDLHIGVENYGQTDPETGLSTRLADFLSSLDEVVEYALTEDVDLVLLAGDAYKGRDPSQTHQREFAKRLSRLSEASIPSFLLVGNHDLPNAVSRATAVEIFQTLQVPYLQVGSNLQNYTIPTKSGPLQILAVPWPRRSGILSREESRGLTIEEVRQAVQDRMTQAIYARAESLDPDVPAILTGHVTVNGATVGTERSMMLGQDHVLLAGDIGRPQVDYVALGHIHKHQILRNENPFMAYSGSLQRVDFSEEGDDKGFCVVDLDPAAPQGKRLTDFDFHRLDARRFVTVDVTVPVGDPDPTSAVVRGIARKDVVGAVVRVRVTLPSEVEAQLRDSDIRDALSEAHYIAAINRESPQEARRTRLDAESAKDLQPMEALRLYLESRGVEPERQEKMLRHAEELVEREASGS
ncbi:MAG: exonuclease SbcCD subunit D [Chloroflexota bacterium]|jgi:exonuclease SbcD|nr:exonuclease SbcCD subunit D [Chloroflexota bacterium]|tara:strand:- start:63 stop:1307 length:1245 start_codon:yes stop_codon:yes gene_type:complete